jgi:hypothetical protein
MKTSGTRSPTATLLELHEFVVNDFLQRRCLCHLGIPSRSLAFSYNASVFTTRYGFIITNNEIYIFMENDLNNERRPPKTIGLNSVLFS